MDRKIGKQAGISLIEILVVVFIITLLTLLSANFVMTYIHKSRLDRSLNLVIGTLEEIRSMSVSRNVSFGVSALSGGKTLDLFIVNPASCEASSVQRSIQMERGVKFDNQVFVMYDRTGMPRNASCGLGMSRITLYSEEINPSYPDRKKSICINRYGRIRVVNGEVCPND